MELRITPQFQKSVVWLMKSKRLPADVFNDYRHRSQLPDARLTELFMNIWNGGMKAEVEISIRHLNIGYEGAKDLLLQYEHRFLRSSMEQRTIRFRDRVYVIQFAHVDQSTVELDYIGLAHLPSNRILICAEFTSVEERDKFHAIAQAAGYADGNAMLTAWAKKALEEHTP